MTGFNKKHLSIFMAVFLCFFSEAASVYGGDEGISALKGMETEIINYARRYNASFYYEDIKTGQSISYNPSKRYPSASTTKTPLVLYVYELAKNGELNLDETMTYTAGYTYGGTGSIQYEKLGTRYTLRELVKRAVRESDNVAYNMLKARVGAGRLHNFTKKLGAQMNNSFNCKELSIHMKAVYDFGLDGGELGRELIGFFKDTIFNDRIPAGVSDMEVAHKIGWLPLYLIYNDEAVIYDEYPYILTIMTQNIPESKQPLFFSELTAMVHSYHQAYWEIMRPGSRLTLNQRSVKTKIPLLTENNRVYIALEDIEETLGMNAVYNDGQRMIAVSKGEDVFSFFLDSMEASVNGIPAAFGEPVPFIKRDTVYLPLRRLCEFVGGISVGWDAESLRVIVTY